MSYPPSQVDSVLPFEENGRFILTAEVKLACNPRGLCNRNKIYNKTRERNGEKSGRGNRESEREQENLRTLKKKDRKAE